MKLHQKNLSTSARRTYVHTYVQNAVHIWGNMTGGI